MRMIRTGFAIVLAAGTIGAAFADAVPVKAPACDAQVIMQIDSAKITPGPNGIGIDAFGTTESAGWSQPVLKIIGTTDGVANVDFIACRPEVSAQVLSPIQVHDTLKLDPKTTRQIIIRAKTNTMTVEITRP
jgi:hypothetical protein